MSTSATTESTAAMQSIMDRLDINSTATSQCCSYCPTRFSERVSSIGEYTCAHCGHHMEYYNFCHMMLPEFSPMEGENVTRSLTYYHWSREENWLENLPSDLMVHIGCKQAAWERMKDVRVDSRWKDDNPEGTVYTITLNPDTPIYPEILLDEEDNAATMSNSYSEDYNGFVERYLNVVEAPGSVSLCAPRTEFTVTGQMSAREFFGDEAMDLNCFQFPQ